MVFLRNQLVGNIAFGHGYHFNQTYGYLPEIQNPTRRVKRVREKRDFRFIQFQELITSRHTKIMCNFVQQATDSGGTSFDWWAHVGADVGRYRSTVLLGSAQQTLAYNYFSNPLNDFELTTSNRTPLVQSVARISITDISNVALLRSLPQPKHKHKHIVVGMPAHPLVTLK